MNDDTQCSGCVSSDTKSSSLRIKERHVRISESRGAFKWLPVYCSNDLVHASWWFVWGSLFGTIVSIFPLLSQYIVFFQGTDTTLPMLEFPSTWGLLIVSCVFFTLGSLAFVRAFEDPPLKPLFRSFRHCATDELLGAWLYLLGTIPAVPYSTVFIFHDPNQLIYWGALVASIGFVVCTSIFVVVSYPSAKELLEPFIQPIAVSICGEATWIHRHLATDWLAATWFFLYATLLWSVASIVLLWVDCMQRNGEEVFVWTSSAVDSFFFLIGSLYFVAGSYPSGLDLIHNKYMLSGDSSHHPFESSGNKCQSNDNNSVVEQATVCASGDFEAVTESPKTIIDLMERNSFRLKQVSI